MAMAEIYLAGLTLNNGSGTAIVGVGVQFGNGDGTFQPAINTFLSDAITAFAVGDFDGDGLTDMVVFHGGKVAVLLGKGDGTFRLAVDNIIQSALSVAVADFNGDGKADLAFSVGTAAGGSLYMLPGNGDGTFQAPVVSPISPLTSGYLLVPGDFNGDGISDLAYTGQVPYENAEGIFLGNGDGTFQAPSILLKDPFFGVVSLLAADFNNDGITDLLAQDFHGNSGITSSSLFVQTNSSNGTSKETFAWSFPLNQVGSVAVGDFDGDGNVDLAVSYSNAVNVFKGNGDGTFQAGVPYGSSQGYTLAADFNGDGRIDLVAGGGTTINVILGTSSTSSISSIAPTSVVIYSPATSLQVYGTNFQATSVVQWNGKISHHLRECDAIKRYDSSNRSDDPRVAGHHGPDTNS